MSAQFRPLLAAGLLIGWFTVAAVIGAVVWCKTQPGATVEESPTALTAEDFPRSESEQEATSVQELLQAISPESNSLAPSGGSLVLPPDIPLPDIPKIDPSSR